MHTPVEAQVEHPPPAQTQHEVVPRQPRQGRVRADGVEVVWVTTGTLGTLPAQRHGPNGRFSRR